MNNNHLSFPWYEPKRSMYRLSSGYGQFCYIDTSETAPAYPIRKHSSDIIVRIPNDIYEKIKKLEPVSKPSRKPDMDTNVTSDANTNTSTSNANKSLSVKNAFYYIDRVLPSHCFQQSLTYKRRLFISTLSVLTMGVIALEWYLFSPPLGKK